MKPRGSPKASSGRTGWPSTIRLNSASSPAAASASVSVTATSYLPASFIVALRCTARNGCHVTDIDVKVIVGRRDRVAGWTDARERQHSTQDGAVALDLRRAVEKVVADAVDVSRGAPAVRRPAARQRVRRRAIATVGHDAHGRADFRAERLERRGEHADRGRDVAWKDPHGRGLAHV